MDLFTANKLTELRKKNSFSQEALAEKIGVSRQAVSKWERGESSPDTDNLMTLAKLYGVTLDDLLGDKKADEILSPAETAAEKVQPEADGSVIGSTVQKIADKVKKSSKEKPPKINAKLSAALLKFPFPIIVAAIFLLIGFTAKIWHPTWLVFMSIPLYYLLALSFATRSKKWFFLVLPVPYLIIYIYVAIGILFSVWTPTWLLFLLIPIYLWAVLAFVKKEKK